MSRSIRSCTNFINETPVNPIEWIEKSVSECWSTLAVKTGDIPFFADVISILIDTSGSTNNVGTGRGGCRRGQVVNDTIPTYKSESQTDPIIAAEIKGVIHYLYEMMEAYNLVGKIIQFYTFSSDLKFVGEFTVDSHQNFENLLKKLSGMLQYDFGGTNLMVGLQKICEDSLVKTKKTHIIVATDGHPNDGGGPDVITNYLKSLAPDVYCNLTMALIGAGSIRLAQGGGTGFRSSGDRTSGAQFVFRTNDAVTTNDVLMFNMKDFCTLLFGGTSSNSECNIEFLIQIMNIMKSSVYLPAFGDYSELHKTAKEYLTMKDDQEVQTKPKIVFKTVLDTCTIALPDHINEILLTSGKVVAFNPAVNAWYLYTTKWQMSVRPEVEIQSTDACYIPFDVNQSINFNEKYHIVRNTKGTTKVFCNNGDFFINTDAEGFVRCRQIIQ